MMNKSRYWFFFLLLVLASSCKKGVDWSVSLSRKEKKPYGGYIAWQSLSKLFPHSSVQALSSSFRYTSIGDDMMYPNGDSISLLILTGFDFQLSRLEQTKLLDFASAGNEVLLFCSAMDEHLERRLGVTKSINLKELNKPFFTQDSLANNRKILTLNPDTSKKYGHFGRSLQGYFKLDLNSKAKVLGYSRGRVNVARFKIGEGHITVHAAPLILSNYFLLQKGNRRYLEKLFSTFPTNISRVYWNNYFRRRAEAENLGNLLRFPAMKWTFFIILLATLCYIVFNGKRRQRIIPVMPSPVNSSVSFVETVGRLYYNKRNHANIAEKMVQQYLEQVRQHYYLSTNDLDEHFAQQLAIKSGKDIGATTLLVQLLYEVKYRTVAVDENYLLRLYKTIEAFAIKK